MEFTDFVDNFKDVLREALCEFCKEYKLAYKYYTIREDDLITFDVDLWYDCELWEYPYEMNISFTLKNRGKDIVIEAEVRDRVRTITIDKTSEKVDWLKDTIIEWIEELLYEDLEKLEKRLASLEFYYRIKDLIDEYDWYSYILGIYHIKIGRSIVNIGTEYINDRLYPKKIYIGFEKKEESIVFADFVEKNIDNIELTVGPSLGEVSINLQPFEPEKRFNILKKVIEALEMMYLF